MPALLLCRQQPRPTLAASAVQPAVGASATVIRPAAAKPRETLPHGNWRARGQKAGGEGTLDRAAAAAVAPAAGGCICGRSRPPPAPTPLTLAVRADKPGALLLPAAHSNAAGRPAAGVLAPDASRRAAAATAEARRVREDIQRQGGRVGGACWAAPAGCGSTPAIGAGSRTTLGSQCGCLGQRWLRRKAQQRQHGLALA